MPLHDKLPPSGGPHPDAAIDYDDDSDAFAAPARFGRLALWMASASALALGVAGTVAYSVWFSHDQRTYVEALATARVALGMTQASVASGEAFAGGSVQPATGVPPEALASTNIESTEPAPTSTPLLAIAPAVPASASVATTSVSAAPASAPGVNRAHRGASTQLAAAHTGRAGTQNQTGHRRPPHQARPDEGLFARMGAFFHRVSYRQHGNTGQREEYSRP